jgi:hypothetical protein
MKRWLLLAEPWEPRDEIHLAAARAWNKAHLNERSNRFWTKSSAALSIMEHDASWGAWVHFRVVRVAELEYGWR